jgi:hypothetical protein
MEWLLANLFSILTLVGVVGGWLIHYGTSRQRNGQVIKEVGEIKTKLDTVCEQFNAHALNADVHVNHLLLKLFDERFATISANVGDARTDIQRIETMLQDQARVKT